MGMMRTDDGTERLQCGIHAVFGSHLPNDLAGLLGDYVKHRAAVIGNDVLGVEPFVPRIEPLVRPDIRASVLEHAMGGATAAHHRVPRRFGMAELIDILGRHPISRDLAVPGHFDHPGRTDKIIAGDLRPIAAAVAQHQGAPAFGHRRHARHVITDRTTFPNKVVVLARRPHWSVAKSISSALSKRHSP